MNIFLILFGKLISILFRQLNLGNGSTWPGHIALRVNKHFISDLLQNSPMEIIIVAGTNGKTTTSSLIEHLLEADGKKVLLNQSGANLLNGIASTLLLNASITGKLPYDFAIFEIDENVIPLILKEVTPDYIVLLNLFRDQLDRYGEVHTIADKWEHAIKNIFSSSEQSESRITGSPLPPVGRTKETTFILNADDPEIAWLGLQQARENVTPAKAGVQRHLDTRLRGNDNILYFGLNDNSLSQKTRDHAVDSVYCPKCNFPLEYKTNYFSHLGDWYCPSCKLARPMVTADSSSHYPLSGTYNQYNTHAAILVVKQIGIDEQTIKSALQKFKPAFGRQEKISMNNKDIQIFLSKNPTSFNQSLETIAGLGGKNLLIVLNDRVADGHDISWIWDTELEQHIKQFTHLTVSGDRCYDLALRVKYTVSRIKNNELSIEETLETAIEKALDETTENETLYILPTYTAMLEVRKILTGKKIL